MDWWNYDDTISRKVSLPSFWGGYGIIIVIIIIIIISSSGSTESLIN